MANFRLRPAELIKNCNIKFQQLAKSDVQTSFKNTEQSCEKSCQCKDHNYGTNNVFMQEWDQNDRNALFTLENYGGMLQQPLFWRFSASRIFPAAFRLMLKIFSLAAKFGGLGSGTPFQDSSPFWHSSASHPQIKFRLMPLAYLQSKSVDVV